MNCYLCAKTAPPQTLGCSICAAVGICRDCGIGLCLEHGMKAAEAGASLLCPECATRRSSLTMPRIALGTPQPTSIRE